MSDIERAAKIADEAAAELEAILNSEESRRAKYDRQTRLQIEYGLKWVKRIAHRIRALHPAPPDETPKQVDDRFAEAQTLLREIRSVVQASARSHWRAMTLKKIDDLIS